MYKYEMHMHTSEGSACGKSTGAEMVEYYRSRGYAGAVVTDHFYHGNTEPSRSLGWREYVSHFSEGYYHAKEAADRLDFDLFFGVEERLIDYSEYLVLGLAPEWYAAHPELRDMFGVEFLDTVRSAGAFVIQAHPFRERPYMTSGEIHLTPHHVDALEIRNCGNPPEIDRRAYEYAKRLGKPMTGGSDNHIASGEDKPLSGIELPFRCKTIEQLIAAIRDGKHTVIDAETAANAPLSEPQYSVTVH